MRQEFTTKTRREAMVRCKGLCEQCGATLWQKARTFDHIIPCHDNGGNELSNCQVLCAVCDAEKTYKRDIPVIAKSKRISDKHQGVKRSPYRPLPGSRASGLRKRMDGTVEKRS